MSIVGSIVLGLIVALAANGIGGGSGKGLGLDLLIGIAGAMIGGVLLGVVDPTRSPGFDIWSVLASAAGAVLMLGVYRAIVGRRRAGDR